MGQKLYSLETRLEARYNSVVEGLTDSENAEKLGLFDTSDRPNYRLIERWRRRAREVGGKYYGENWEKFQAEHQKKRDEERRLAGAEIEREKLSEMVAHAEEFRTKKVKTLNYLMNLAMREMTPRRDEKTGEVALKPNFNMLKCIKIASESFKINSDQFTEMLAEFFLTNQVEEEDSSSWASMLESRYIDEDMTLLDPAMNPEFYQGTDEAWQQKYIEAPSEETG